MALTQYYYYIMTLQVITQKVAAQPIRPKGEVKKTPLEERCVAVQQKALPTSGAKPEAAPRYRFAFEEPLEELKKPQPVVVQSPRDPVIETLMKCQKDVQVRAKEIAAFVSSHREEWVAEAEKTKGAVKKRLEGCTRSVLVTNKGNIFLLPKKTDAPIDKGAQRPVFKGFELTTGKAVAIAKMTLKTTEKRAISLAHKEATILQVLRNKEGIIHTLRVQSKEAKGVFKEVIIQELGDCNLFKAINKLYLSEKSKKQIALDILTGVAILHSKGILHRDLKPSNIVIFTDPHTKEIRAKIIDFGLSCLETEMEERAIPCGTYHYFAPEQAQQVLSGLSSTSSFATKEADVYAVGLILGSLFSGTYPSWICAPNGTELFTQVKKGWKPELLRGSKEIIDLIQRMLAVDPKKRPSAEEALVYMQQVCTYTQTT